MNAEAKDPDAVETDPTDPALLFRFAAGLSLLIEGDAIDLSRARWLKTDALRLPLPDGRVLFVDATALQLLMRVWLDKGTARDQVGKTTSALALVPPPKPVNAWTEASRARLQEILDTCWLDDPADDAHLRAALAEISRLQDEEANGDCIAAIRADLKERFGVEAAFFDDVVALALTAAVREREQLLLQDVDAMEARMKVSPPPDWQGHPAEVYQRAGAWWLAWVRRVIAREQASPEAKP